MDILRSPASDLRSPLRRAAVKCVDAWEEFYRRRHRLQPVGPLFLLGVGRHAGPEKQFDDDVKLQDGDPIGILHFNNTRIAQLGGSAGRHRTAWEFTRLLRGSLIALAEFSASDAGSHLPVFQGTTWLQPHGVKVGFTIESLPPGWRSRWLQIHFRLLQLCFSPASLRYRGTGPEPRLFWITRPALRHHFLPMR